MIRVLIADDHAIVRQGLRQILADEPDMTVAGEAASGEELLALARQGGADILVLDLSLPGMSGLEVLHEVKHLLPRLPVLVLSVYGEDQYAVRAIKAGASGYLTKETAPEELVRAIRMVIQGEKYLGPGLASRLADIVAGVRAEKPHELLSDREFEVMRLLALGKRVNEIAGEMNLSPKTVSTYRRRVLDKMHMAGNPDLVQYAVRERLIDADKHP